MFRVEFPDVHRLPEAHSDSETRLRLGSLYSLPGASLLLFMSDSHTCISKPDLSPELWFPCQLPNEYLRSEDP